MSLLKRMTVVLNVYNATKSYMAGSNNLAEWARMYPSQLEIVSSIREMRQNA